MMMEPIALETSLDVLIVAVGLVTTFISLSFFFFSSAFFFSLSFDACSPLSAAQALICTSIHLRTSSPRADAAAAIEASVDCSMIILLLYGLSSSSSLLSLCDSEQLSESLATLMKVCKHVLFFMGTMGTLEALASEVFTTAGKSEFEFEVKVEEVPMFFDGLFKNPLASAVD